MRRTTKTVIFHLLMAGACLGGRAAWRWQLRWGATAAEQRRALPGDASVSAPNLQATRAVGIAAPPDAVWPWVAQIGQDKAGFYSYDWLERAAGLPVDNADSVVPEWQDPHVGDPVNLAEDMALRVAVAEPGRALVLVRPSAEAGPAGFPPFEFSWAFTLEPEGPTGTRLVVRERYVWLKWRSGAVVRLAAWVSFFMSRRMLLGIRARSERAWRERVEEPLDCAVGDVLDADLAAPPA
ncbi:MAG: hypothetical protein LBL01_03265 [Bifidobacteriaceae bacterium]|jgi:hypothetical protein|nr:hypothetical protein [Bifidobacteriaceae bacterium]